jgi:hypothetical protein
VLEQQSKTFKVGVGPIANLFAVAGGADALVLTRYFGFDKSGGQRAKEVVANVLPAVLTHVAASSPGAGGRVEVGLVDGMSGDVLWTNKFAAPEPAGTILQRALEALPSVSLRRLPSRLPARR